MSMLKLGKKYEHFDGLNFSSFCNLYSVTKDTELLSNFG